MPRPRFRRHRAALAVRTIALLAISAARPAAAETAIQLDGTANLGYSEVTGNPSSSQLYTEIRPGLALQFGSPRLVWRTGYVFSGSFTIDGSGPSSYSNAVDLSLAAQLTSRSTLTLSASATQGGTAFQLSQRALETSQPGFRAAGNPDLVSATLTEALAWEAAPAFRVRQGLAATASAPQDALGLYSVSAIGTLGLDRLFQDDAIGIQLRPSVSVLCAPDGQHYLNTTNALLGSWNHDFDPSWNGQATAGVEQVLTFAGSYPLAVVPTGSLTGRYLAASGAGTLSYTHGVTTNLQTGTVSMSDAVVARGVFSFDPVEPRMLGVSAGFAHARPLGQAASQVAAGTGNAVQGDVRLLWGLGSWVLATATYSAAYQFGQGGGLAPSLAQVILVGITVRYASDRQTPPVPTLGGRVDGSDAVPFPGSR